MMNTAVIPTIASQQEDSHVESRPTDSVLSVEDLWVLNGQNDAIVKGISFEVPQGSTLGIVGESGSGKTILLKSVLGVLPPHFKVASGRIDLLGTDVLGLNDKSWRPLRGKGISAIFQDPGSYLNPSIPVGKQLAEVLRIRGKFSRRAAKREAISIFDRLYLRSPELVYHQYPFELSGGMLQRVLMAIALCLEPEVLIADEATTALDVTVQAELLDLLKDLKTTLGLSLVLVSHDLAVIAQTADYVLVIRDGEVIEEGPTEQVLHFPKAPYTQLLVNEHAQYGLDKFLVPASSPLSQLEEVQA